MDKRLTDTSAQIQSVGMTTLNGFNHLAMMQRGSIDHITMMLAGNLDFDLRCAFSYIHNEDAYPQTVAQLMTDRISETMAQLKDRYSRLLSNAMREEERQEEIAQRRLQEEQFARSAKRFVSMSAPSPEGTVAEIAERYGVSKSHVRLLKREGRLNELTQNQS